MMLAQMSWPQWMLGAVVIVVCILLMIVILLQRGRGGGLSGAFGGGGGSAAFGAKTGDIFTWITVGFTTVFVLLTVVANFAFDESAAPEPEAEETVAVDETGAGTVDAGDAEGIRTVELGGEPVQVEGVTITPVNAPSDEAGNGDVPASGKAPDSTTEPKEGPSGDSKGDTDGDVDGSDD